jgi:hypothetical protein
MRRENGEIKSIKKAAGEYHATKQITRRPDPARVHGLHARVKDHYIILQTGK